MNKKIFLVTLVGLFFLAGCNNKDSQKAVSSSGSKSSLTTNSTTKGKATNSEVQSSKTESDTKNKDNKKDDKINIEGFYYSKDNYQAVIKQVSGNNYMVFYETSAGSVNAKFKNNMHKDGKGYQSVSQMTKADGSQFEITITKMPTEMTIKMSDGNPKHTMVFAAETQANSRVNNASQDKTAILNGDLTSFAGQYSSNELEKSIADSGFTMGGYQPEDYYSNNTTYFPKIGYDKDSGKWEYWIGGVHAFYTLDTKKAPKKIDNYYQVNFVGANGIAVKGSEVVLYLIPANVAGPDGTTSNERRIYDLYTKAYSRQYHDGWWKAYQH